MIRLSEYSDRGGRECNEDSTSLYSEADRHCLVVADGLGGHGGGKTASSMVAEGIVRAFATENEISSEWIYNLLQEKNNEVYRMQTIRCKMRTTCVVLFLEKDVARWAHLGDSRLYHFENGKIVFYTLDHSVSQMAVQSGEITRDKIRFHEDRNRVLRCLGVEGAVKPDIKECSLSDDLFHAFLLCSDGFWEYVTEDEMEIDLAKAGTPEAWIQYMKERLLKKVNGKNDNFSAAAMFYRKNALDFSCTDMEELQ